MADKRRNLAETPEERRAQAAQRRADRASAREAAAPGEMRDAAWDHYPWAERTHYFADRARTLAKSYDWRVRNGARVPAAECLRGPGRRVSVRDFAALMGEMGAGPLDLGGDLQPAAP